MRIKLDRTKCDGFGTCAVWAPDLFSLDDWGYASLEDRTGQVAPGREADARRALLDCPVHAILELAEPLPVPRPTTTAGPELV